MGMLDLDITKRSDAARKSSRRAEMKLIQEMNKAGGIEDEMRYQLSLVKRKQTVLQKELHTLRFESKRLSRRASDGCEISSKSSEEIFSMRENQDVLSRRRASDYGKNFFGYHSTPGSKKVIKKSTRELEKSLDDYCKKIDELIHEENIGKKLYHQQKENKSVQDRLDSWMVKNSSKSQAKTFLPRLTGSSSSAREKSIHGNNVNDRSDSRGETKLEVENKSLFDSEKPSPTENSDSELLPPVDEAALTVKPKPDWLKETEKPTSAKSTDKERKRSSNLSAKRSSNEMVFDADLYAPDGRIRMAHRMPEFHLAFHQARKARYVRTNEKREFEVQLSVDEIFRSVTKRRTPTQDTL